MKPEITQIIKSSQKVRFAARVRTKDKRQTKQTHTGSNLNHMRTLKSRILGGFEAQCYLVLERTEIFDCKFLYHGLSLIFS